MNRRAWLGQGAAACVAVGAAAALAGCGFRLRQAGDFAFASIYLDATEHTALTQELRRQLQAMPALTVFTRVQTMPQAQVLLDVLGHQRERVVVGTNASGQVRELQLRMGVRFRLRGQDGAEWIEPVELFGQRNLNFSEAAALSKEIEEAALYREMQGDIVAQMLRRISHAKPPVGR